MELIDHKLKGPFQGALAGGGDPASSPLYVFGPFFALLVPAGVAAMTYGASIWLAVLTVVTVSAMYRLVIRWVIDGSGGSGLCEEEFGSWAVKINGGLTLIEYTLTFLVSITALVTFLADRLPLLNDTSLVLPNRAFVAIIMSVLIGFTVNLGPKMAMQIFGPATLGVLILLWAMMGATIWTLGLHFPPLHLSAFNTDNLHFTLAGYAKILALMTGIEVFANLVVAYHGSAKARSNQAFGSLLIIMCTTSLSMLIIGPAILQLTDPANPHVSVFTQAMDQLLPTPLSYLGTLVGVLVLLSAAAASAQGIQNLALGLRFRHYLPAWFSQLNRFEVADKPVWTTVIVCIICFMVFGTSEVIYLALYAAGVFILLSLTGWAAVKRLVGQYQSDHSYKVIWNIVGIIIAAILTTSATIIIFIERFTEGAWFYFALTPLFFIIFSHFRARLGSPPLVADRIGLAISSSMLPQPQTTELNLGIRFKNILVPLDQTPVAECAISCAQTVARTYDGTITLLTVLSEEDTKPESHVGTFLPFAEQASARDYLMDVMADLTEAEYRISMHIKKGEPASVIVEEASHRDIDLVIMTTHGRSLVRRWITHHVTTDVIQQATPPLIVIRPTDEWRSIRTRFKRLLVTLDASATAEQVLPYAYEIAQKFSSHVTLLSVPEAADTDDFVTNLKTYLEKIALTFKRKGIRVTPSVNGHSSAQTILKTIQSLNIDLVMMVSHGRGGVERQAQVKLGSVADEILQESICPVFLVSAQ